MWMHKVLVEVEKKRFDNERDQNRENKRKKKH